MPPSKQIALFLLLLTSSWFVMLFSHETGHLICGFLSGATLTSFDLAPWRLPYSFHNPDPHPLVTLWGGPWLGIALPLLVSCAWQNVTTRFVADFCLLANGCYIGLGIWAGDNLLDSQRLIDAGASQISLALFSALAIAIGYVRFRCDCVEILSKRKLDKEV